MKDLVLYGNYYKAFKGNGGIPEKITVIAMNGDNITFVKGHYNRDIFAERGNTIDEAIKNMCLVKNVCKADKILTTITKKQEQSIEAEERKIQTMKNKADKALEEFKNGFQDRRKQLLREKTMKYAQLGLQIQQIICAIMDTK